MLHTFNEPPNSLRDVFSVCVLEVDRDPDRHLKEGGKKNTHAMWEMNLRKI